MINNYMLYRNLPTIDLHGENRYSAIVLIEDFIKDNKKLKNKLFIIIHGVGEGILKESIHRFLKNNKEIKAYKNDVFNPGATIVELF